MFGIHWFIEMLPYFFQNDLRLSIFVLSDEFGSFLATISLSASASINVNK
jgi:hypothetical protein